MKDRCCSSRSRRKNYSAKSYCPAWLLFGIFVTLCRDVEGSSCNILRSGVSAEEAENILDLHNKLRSKVASGRETEFRLPPATDMLQLEWNRKLAQKAQHQSDQCVFDQIDTGNLGIEPLGRNMYRKNVLDPENYETEWDKVIDFWYSQGKYYNRHHLDYFGYPDEEVGQFTQIIWAETDRLGCGFTLYEKEGIYKAVYSCSYAPAGNFIGDIVYFRGQPCIDCPTGYCCGKTCKTQPSYEGLCKM